MLCLFLLLVLLPASSRRFIAIGIAGLSIALIIGVFHSSPNTKPPDSFEQMQFEAVVESDPKVRGDGVSAYLRWREQEQTTSTTSFAFLPAAPAVGRHDRILASGSYNQSSYLDVSSMKVVRIAGRAEILRRDIRNWISRTVHSAVPGSPGTLALGLLIGDDSGLTDDERDEVREAGLSHITAVSGWNVTLVALTTAAIFAALRLRSWPLLAAQILIIGLYVWIVGLDPPVLRAAIMAAAALVAIQTGSPVHILTLLVLAAAAMALIDPDTLSSLSFQLSFLSMLGLIAVVAISLDHRRKVAVVVAPVIATLSAAVATAPLIALSFGAISLGTLPANILVAPLVPLATYGAALVAVTGPLPVLSNFIGIPVWLLCSTILLIAETVASFPWAFLEFEPPGGNVVAAIYILFAALTLPFLPEGRYLLRSVSEWATQYPAQACITGISAASVIFLVVLTG